ncbi:hypothetical protein F3Y22_tig00110865pilonHSYRG00018 [Hibiscus syriacus]|uniref:RNase H type-1 domain-containing protein n=1 Tax=Hibiscus syriacus TaxID=106335 RepID=A0A6A2ZL04_HIBSY|nr:hypothetical protein F3Y22_tig00110865pilonHSYRG00018 [Hibiscus syriacus]
MILSHGGPYLSHLFFAGDLVLFYRANQDQDLTDNLCNSLGFQLSTSLGNYLRMPLFQKRTVAIPKGAFGSRNVRLPVGIKDYQGIGLLGMLYFVFGWFSRNREVPFSAVITKSLDVMRRFKTSPWMMGSGIYVFLTRCYPARWFNGSQLLLLLVTTWEKTYLCGDRITPVLGWITWSTSGSTSLESLFGGSGNIETMWSSMVQSRRLSKWTKLIQGCFKLKTDGAMHTGTMEAACGGVIRDHTGAWVAGFSRSLGRCTTFQAELWAVMECLKIAWNMGVCVLNVELDIEEVATHLNKLDDSLAGLDRKRNLVSIVFSAPPPAFLSVFNSNCIVSENRPVH